MTNKRGQSLVEYIALTALVAIVCISTVKFFGSKVKTRLNQVTQNFDSTIGQGLRTRSQRDESKGDLQEESQAESADQNSNHSPSKKAGRFVQFPLPF